MDMENSTPKPIPPKMSRTSDLLNMLQTASTSCLSRNNDAFKNDLPPDNKSNPVKLKTYLEIKCGRNLKVNCNTSKENVVSPPISSEAPSTYVTFQADKCNLPLVESNEGMVYSTSVAEKTISPIWNMSTLIFICYKYLLNQNTFFELKTWKKNLTNSSFPNPKEDTLLGSTMINLSILRSNVSSISNWFDIVDLKGNVNGQIKVVVRPVDLQAQLMCQGYDSRFENIQNKSNLILGDINLEEAIKNKFSELEQISERLRMRLFKVTDDLQFEVSDIKDEEFEHDLNTTAYEDENEFLPKLNFLSADHNFPSI